MKNGMIKVDSAFGEQIGFVSDRFRPSSYLWLDDPYIWVSLIELKHLGKGHLAHMFRKIVQYGYGIKVPSPSSRMTEICEKNGFEATIETTDIGPCHTYVKHPAHLSQAAPAAGDDTADK